MLIATLLASAQAYAGADAICGRVVAPIDRMVFEITAQVSGQILTDTSDLVAVSEAQRKIVWTFVKRGRAAGPAIVCRQVVERAGAFHVDLQARCAGPKPACDALIARFREPKQAE